MPKSVVIFPDTERELVSALKLLLNDPTIHVGVRKAQAGQIAATTQIVIRSDGSTPAGVVHRVERFGVNIWRVGSHGDATILGERVIALLKALPAVSSIFKDVDSDSGLIRLAAESGEEQRYFTFSALIQGSTLTI